MIQTNFLSYKVSFACILLCVISLFLLFTSCTTLSSKSKSHTEYVNINPNEYYENLINHFIPDSKYAVEIRYPICVVEIDRIKVMVIKKDDTFLMRVQMPGNALSSTTIYKDSIVDEYMETTLVSELCFPLGTRPLEELFEFADLHSFFYDVATMKFDPFDERFALFDSSGQIKLLADQNTLIPTRKKRKKIYGKALPFSKEQKRYVYGITNSIFRNNNFDERFISNREYWNRIKDNMSKFKILFGIE